MDKTIIIHVLIGTDIIIKLKKRLILKSWRIRNGCLHVHGADRRIHVFPLSSIRHFNVFEKSNVQPKVDNGGTY